jgi:Kef-type K+ transport system membrane component KefB
MILGPSLLGRFRIFNRILFSTNSQEIIGMVSVWSYIIFMFVSAVKMDIGMINRSGRKALFTGVVCVLLPFLISFPIQVKLGQYYKLNEDETHALPHITIVHCLTPFPVLACLLEDLKILNSELGRLSLSAATVSDMLSTFLTLFSDLTRTMEGVMNGHMVAAKHLGEVIIYLIVIVFAIRPAILWVIRQTPKGRPVSDTYIHTIMLMVLGSGLLSHHLFGVSFFLGPFLLGLAVPDGPPLGSAIVNKFNCFISDVFLPIFITTCGMRSDLSLIKFNNAFMNINGFIIVLTFVTKMAACLVPPFCSKMPINDALALALLLSYKGVVQLSACTRLEDEKVTIFLFSLTLFFFSSLLEIKWKRNAINYIFIPQ